MGRYYPYSWFCNKYGMWCNDVVDLTDGENDCNGDCTDCDYGEEIE